MRFLLRDGPADASQTTLHCAQNDAATGHPGGREIPETRCQRPSLRLISDQRRFP